MIIHFIYLLFLRIGIVITYILREFTNFINPTLLLRYTIIYLLIF